MTGRIRHSPRPPVIDPASDRGADGACRGAGKADGLAGPLLEALGVGAIRSRHPRQHRAAAGRRCRGGARAGWPEGARAHDRRDAALLRGRSVRRRQAGGGGSLAQSHRGRRPAARGHRQSQFRQSRAAGDHGPVRRLHPRHREACKALDFPVVSGNVSLYNETNGRAILPTPTIGGVGLLDDFTKSASIAFKAAGERSCCSARPRAGSASRSICARSAAARRARRRRSILAERRNGDFVRALIDEGS